ncbi:carbohydrate ABC transporter permease [Mycetocola saprophilus]|uniref:carbohydrate ABC transporter permease n=1 Tax=Mycetocola saprophilus TaxID=76636 RepID=UPI000AFE5D36|nr:carbohydrate ABC transporter permease [Mycetocola saprophilus]
MDRILTTSDRIERVLAWVAGLLWIAPLAYVFVRSVIVESPGGSRFGFDNLTNAWSAAPFGQYYLNTTLLVVGITLAQLVFGALAAYAFARFTFPFKNALFVFVLIQLMIFPEVFMSENYRTVAGFGLLDTITGIGLPYVASAFCIFFLRQAFMTVPNELVEAAQVEGSSRLGILWKVFLPAAKPSIIAYALVSVSTQWNNFLWPMIVATSDETRPITVGLVRFLAPETGMDFPKMAAGTVIVIGPLLAAFLIGQRGFINSFLRSGIK